MINYIHLYYFIFITGLKTDLFYNCKVIGTEENVSLFVYYIFQNNWRTDKDSLSLYLAWNVSN